MKKPATSLFYKSLAFYLAIMLSSQLVLIALFYTVGFGQSSFTPVDYNFQNRYGKNQTGYTNQETGSRPFGALYSASNGYGTWIVTKDGEWGLIGDTLNNESATNNVPSGLIASGKIFEGTFNTHQVKVAANLKGSVRYVWFEQFTPAGQVSTWSIHIAGFDDHSTSAFPIQNINVIADISDLSSSGNYRNIVTNIGTRIHRADPIPVRIGNQPLLFGGVEDDDWRDLFDIAIDEKFLYVVYSHIDEGNEKYEIYTLPISLDTWEPVPPGTTAGGTTYGTSFSLNTSNAKIRRPTVAAPVRNSPTNPIWDIAFLAYDLDVDGSGTKQFTDVGYMKVKYTISSQTYSIVGQDFLNDPDPLDLNKVTHRVGTGLASYGYPRHARIVDGSINPSTASVRKAIYVTTDCTPDYGAPFPNMRVGGLVCYFLKPMSAQDVVISSQDAPILHGAFFVDGNTVDPAGGDYVASQFSPYQMQYVDPVTNLTKDLQYYVLDEPITAFANPYDGKSTDANTDYNEFHCVYRVIANRVSQNPPLGYPGHNPTTYNPNNDPKPILMIANGALQNTKTVLNRYFDATWLKLTGPLPTNSDPVYSASVNQMGIHVFWEVNDESPKSWYYKRDLRYFDEPIEEKTLVTNFCVVGDGQGHLGTVGAQILPGNVMTLWTDPNFDNSVLFYRDPASADGFNNAQLLIKPGIFLTVGDPDMTNTNPATLNLPPNFEVIFAAPGLPQGFLVYAKSKLEYYGKPNSGSATSLLHNFHGDGSISLIGKTDNTSPAILNIHGGAFLRVPDRMKLSVTNSTVNVLLEQSLPSFIELFGTASFDQSLFQNAGTAMSGTSTEHWVWRALVCKPLDDESYANVPETQLTLINSIVKCNNGNSRLEVSCNGNVSLDATIDARKVLVKESAPSSPTHTAPLVGNERYFSVTGDEGPTLKSVFDHATLYVANPADAPGFDNNEILVTNTHFVGALNFGLYFFRSDVADYHNIMVDGCKFSGGNNPALIEGFDKPLAWLTYDDNGNSISHNRVNLVNNEFTGGGTDATAISINNSNIGVGNNVIIGGTSNFFKTGISQSNENTSSTSRKSFLCNNTISHCNNGILCDNWSDYIKLSSISECGIGLFCRDDIDGFLSYSVIEKCNQQGIFLNPVNSSNISKLNAQSRYNSIELNNSTAAGAGTDPTGQIQINDGSFLIIRNRSNLVRRTGHNPNDNFIYHPGTSIAIGSPNITGDELLDNIYWADNSSSSTSPYTAATVANTSPDANLTGITYTDATPETGHSGMYSTSGVFCSSGLPTQIGGKGKSSLLIIDSSPEYCSELILEAEGYESTGQYQTAYDIYKSYFESCAGLSTSWYTFSDIGSVNAARNDNNYRFEEFREWLKKVLYYNEDTNYYCADVKQMLSTFDWFNNLRGKDYRGSLALLYFLVKENRCPNTTGYYDTVLIPARWEALYTKWLDTVNEPGAVFDSTLPTLEDLGLGILRGDPADVKYFNNALQGPLVSGLYSTPNPFTSETKVSFMCRESVLLKFEVLDILGHKLYDGGTRVFDKGENQIVLPGKGIPNGLLYGRFVLPDGSARTVKLRKIE